MGFIRVSISLFTTSSKEESKRLLRKTTSPSVHFVSPLGFFVDRVQPLVQHGNQTWAGAARGVVDYGGHSVRPLVFEHVSSLPAWV